MNPEDFVRAVREAAATKSWDNKSLGKLELFKGSDEQWDSGAS